MPIFGAKSRAARGCALKLACGHRIGPAEQAVLTEIYGEFATSQRADVGIGPYTIPEGFPKTKPRTWFAVWKGRNGFRE